MILTLTANPSIDRTVTLDQPLTRGAVQRVTSVTNQAAGKGVNVVRVVAAAGHPSLAVVPAGKNDPFTTRLRAQGVDHVAVSTPGDVRVNLAVIEPDGTTTKINEPGARLSVQVLDELTRVLVEHAGRARWVVLAGSLPPGVAEDWYAQLVPMLRTAGTRVAVDTSGAPLLACCTGAQRPHLIKPNGEELAELAGAGTDPETDLDAAVAACRTLVRNGIEAVLATLGAGGAVLVTAAGAWYAAAPHVSVKSTVGAGDSTLSGYLIGHTAGAGPAACLRRAVAYGTAAVQLPGSSLPTPREVRPQAVCVTALPATTGGARRQSPRSRSR
ncbi:MAG: 1-phosphofructokinase [Micrococcales bacterium]|nr:MAG: 1-phosphofructokinase [Micrococcales bacterium]